MDIDILWIILGAILLILGIIGSFAPVLPGPPLSYAALLMLMLTDKAPFTTRFLVIWAIVAVVILILDYVIPAIGTKKFGGTKYGQWGSMAGVVIGIFLGPPGIIAGPFLGAILGELIGGKDMNFAIKSGIGSFLGFLAGTFIKLLYALVMAYFFIASFF
jgi:uncharacterized protein YqgC (DUF456 family)